MLIRGGANYAFEQVLCSSISEFFIELNCFS